MLTILISIVIGLSCLTAASIAFVAIFGRSEWPLKV